MESYNLKWNKNLKELIIKYKFMRKLHLNEENKIKKLGIDKEEYEKYHIFKLDKDISFIIKNIKIENNRIVDITIYLLSNDYESINNAYSTILEIPNKEWFYTLVINHDNKGFFFDDKIGIIKNFDRCLRCHKAMLSDLDNLKDIFKLDKKEDGYYINDNKFISIDRYEKYSQEVFDSLGREKLSNIVYYTIRHFGPYDTIKYSYDQIIKLIKLNKEKIIGLPMEEYINGRWNSDDEGSYITNIMIPVEYKE